ncbi:MAG: hypothetical protein JW771_08445 [Candidatus Thermoplasmatota archaeon]|nr:hypothetical protein [Candidatus Thermoplasmatota archaeon]
MNQVESIQGNYWKEIQNELPYLLKNLNGIVLVTHNSIEFIDIIDFLNNINPEHFSNVLYISLMRSYNYMKLAIDKKPLELKRMFFIDCVSGFAFPPEDNIDDCIYHKPPQNLEELKNIIKYGVEKCNPDIIVLDSLSQYINFTIPTDAELRELYKFLKTIKEDVLGITCYAVLLLYDDKLGSMKKLPTPFTDLILKLEVIKGEMEWTD